MRSWRSCHNRRRRPRRGARWFRLYYPGNTSKALRRWLKRAGERTFLAWDEAGSIDMTAWHTFVTFGGQSQGKTVALDEHIPPSNPEYWADLRRYRKD